MTTTAHHPDPLQIAATRALVGRGRTLSALEGLIDALEADDPCMNGHSRRVADLAAALAVAIGASKGQIAALHEAALLHDIGKVAVPHAILSKDGPLTSAEVALVKCHSEVGASIAAGVLTDRQARWIRHHHERWDGRGYPDGIDRRDISPEIAVLTVADSFDAMTQRRHSGRQSVEGALEECIRESGRQFVPYAVRALAGLVECGALPRRSRGPRPPADAGGPL